MAYDILEELPGYDIIEDAPVEPVAISPEPVGEAEGYLRAGQRGLKSLETIVPTAMAIQAARERRRLQSAQPTRKDFVRAMSDPEYIAGLDSEVPTLKVQAERGPGARLHKEREASDAKFQIWSGVLADVNKEREAIPKSKIQTEMAKAVTSGDKWAVWRKAPVQVTASIVLESLPPSLAGGLVGAVAGPGGVVAGAGLSSFAMTASGELMGEAASAGYDITDADSLGKFLSKPEIFENALQRSLLKATVVGQVDAATAGLAGRFIGPALKQGLGQILKASGKEVAQQAIGGSAGELVGQIATKDGKPIDWFDVAMEGVAETFTAPMEAIGNIRQGRRFSQYAPAETPEQEQDLRRLRQTVSQLPQQQPWRERRANATRIRSDTRQPETPGQVVPGSQTDSGRNVQQAPPGQPEPVAPRKEEEAPAQPVLEIIQIPSLADPLKSFKPGSLIQLPGLEGEVEAVTENSVSVRRPDGNLVKVVASEIIPVTPTTEPTPKPKQPRPKMDRPWDIIDEIENNYGPIRGKKTARPGTEGYYGEAYRDVLRGVARRLFSNKKGQTPDVIVDDLRRSGFLPENATVDDLWSALDNANKARRGARGVKKSEQEVISQEEAQHEEFAKHTFTDGPNKQSINVGELLEGDTLEIDGEKFTVAELIFNRDTGDLTYVQLEDGRRFGVQTVSAEQVIYPDKGSVERKEPSTDFLPPEEAKTADRQNVPSARQNVPRGTNLTLEKPESVDEQKARLEREAAEAKKRQDRETVTDKASAPLKGSTGDLGQGDLLGGPTDLFAPKAPNLGAVSSSSSPATAPAPEGSPALGGITSALSAEEQAELAALEAELKAKLGRVNVGVDPTLITTGGRIAILYAKAGYRTFKAFADVMLAKMGEAGRAYLLTWYNNARLTVGPQGFDDEPTAQRTFDSDYGPSRGRAVPRTDGRSGGRRVAVAKVVRAELIPEPRGYVRDDEYAGTSGFVLSDDQTLGANQALTHFLDRKGSAFLLGDGPGFGKTAQLLVVVDQFLKRNPQAKILYVTQNEQMIEGTISDDSKAMGIDLSRITMATYTGIKKLIAKDNPLREQQWDLVVFDEAHNLKNGEAQKSMAAAVLNVQHTLFATATPMDRPTGAAYFLAAVTGKTEEQVAEELGYMLQSKVDPYSDKTVVYAVLKPKTTWAKVWSNIVAFRDAAIGHGAMLRRAYPFFGDVETVDISMDFTAKMEHERLVKFYDDWADRVSNRPMQLARALGQKTLGIRRWSEQHKIKRAYDRAKQWMKETGGQVIIMAETADVQSFRADVQNGEQGTNDQGFPVWRVPGAIQKLTAMFTADGIPLAHIHSPKHQKVAAEVKKFQARQAPVALATPGSGGAGINLDDTVGDAPRLLILLSKNLAGDMWDQIIGRVSRKNTQSASKIELFHMPDSYGDQRAQDIADKKVRTLRAIQGGEDADVGGLDSDSGKESLTLEGWDSIPGQEPEPDTTHTEILESSATVVPVLEAIAKGNDQHAEVARALLSVGAASKLEFLTVEEFNELGIAAKPFGPTLQGFYDRSTDTIYIMEGAVNQTVAVLHESMHAVTVGKAMRDPEFAARVEALWNEATAAAKVNYYGLTNPYEFVAEAFVNPEFQTFLKRVNRGTFWQRLLNAVRSWIGMEQADLSLFARVMNVVRPQMEAPTAGEGMFALDLVPDDDEKGVPTEVMGTVDYVKARDQLTPQMIEASHAYAKLLFTSAGVGATFNTENQIWMLDVTNATGRRLVEVLRDELANVRTVAKPDLASFVSSIVLNFKLGRFGDLDLSVRHQLYSLAQGERSHRGLALGMLSKIGNGLDFLGANVDVVLQRIYTDALGGEALERFLNAVRKHFTGFFKDQAVLGALEADPTLKQIMDDLKIKAEGSRAMPTLRELIEDVLKIPFYSQDEFFENIRKKLIDLGATKENAERSTKLFMRAFSDKMKSARTRALERAKKDLTPAQQGKIPKGRGIWDKIERAVNAGMFDTATIVQQLAKSQGWRPPTTAEIDRFKEMAEREMRLRTLTDEEAAEIEAFSPGDKTELERAREEKESATIPQRLDLKRQMEVAWARMVRPINVPGLTPESWAMWWRTRKNLAAAGNEFASANLLLKIGFAPRLAVSIATQGNLYVPTRAIAQAMVMRADAKFRGESTSAVKEVATQLKLAYANYHKTVRASLNAMRASFLGRGEVRSVDRLVSSIAALDRVAELADVHFERGNYGRAIGYYLLSIAKFGYRTAAALDNLQGVPAEYQEMRFQVKRALRRQGRTAAEAEIAADMVIGDMKHQWLQAIETVKNIYLDNGIEASPAQIREAAWSVVKRWQYQRMEQLGLQADDFEEDNRLLRSTISWNEREVRGLGGAVATLGKTVSKIGEAGGVPLPVGRFANAIGISINRLIAYTPLFAQANIGPGSAPSAWFASDVDQAQRRVEALAGSMLGALMFSATLAGFIVWRGGWPKDKEERDMWEREGHRPYTIEIPVEGGFIPISLNNSPFQIVSPYIAAAGKLREILSDREKQQARLDAEALKEGRVAEKLPALGAMDLAMSAWEAAKQSILGTRTAAGMVSSITQYGVPNADKAIASQIAPLIPGLPGYQELARMGGVVLDEKAATVWDFMVPLPTSTARKVNMLGDPVGTPSDIQRITQLMTGGTYPGVVRTDSAREDQAYRNLFASGYRPPSIQPGRGYLIGNGYRVFNESELSRYTVLRGQYLKEELSGFDSEDPALSKAAYARANARALQSMGVTVRSRKTRVRRPRRPTRRYRAPKLSSRRRSPFRSRARRRFSAF